MDSEQWKQLDELLHAALQRPPEKRDAFLREACAGDEPLERQARSLLALEQKAGGFLERPAIEMAARVAVREQTDDSQEAGLFRTGAIVSHYRILGKLGGGGRLNLASNFARSIAMVGLSPASTIATV